MIKKGFKTFVIDDYLKIILKIISNEFKSLHSGSKHLLLHEKPAHLRSTTALLAKRWSHIASLRAGTSAVEKTDLRKAIVAGVRVYLCRLFSFVVYGAGCRHWSLGHTREALCCRVVSSVLGSFGNTSLCAPKAFSWEALPSSLCLETLGQWDSIPVLHSCGNLDFVLVFHLDLYLPERKIWYIIQFQKKFLKLNLLYWAAKKLPLYFDAYISLSKLA